MIILAKVREHPACVLSIWWNTTNSSPKQGLISEKLPSSNRERSAVSQLKDLQQSLTQGEEAKTARRHDYGADKWLFRERGKRTFL